MGQKESSCQVHQTHQALCSTTQSLASLPPHCSALRPLFPHRSSWQHTPKWCRQEPTRHQCPQKASVLPGKKSLQNTCMPQHNTRPILTSTRPNATLPPSFPPSFLPPSLFLTSLPVSLPPFLNPLPPTSCSRRASQTCRPAARLPRASWRTPQGLKWARPDGAH